MRNTIPTLGTISWRRRLVPATIALGLVLGFAQSNFAQSVNGPLNFGNNFFVTGDYVVGGVSLGGVGSGGFATGTITIPDANPGIHGTKSVPAGAQIVAALLYWQTIELVGGATGQNGFFRPVFSGGPQTGYPIQGTMLNNSNGPVYWDGTGCSSTSPTQKHLVTYRADVRAGLRQDANGNVLANGAYEVTVASQSNGAPLTLGATLVLIYRVLDPNVPLNSIVIYDGTFAPTSSSPIMNQTVQGFYQAAASPVSKLTYIAGNGQKNHTETLSLSFSSTNPPSSTTTPVPLRSLYTDLNLPSLPGWYPGGSWDTVTYPFPAYANLVPAGAASAITSVTSDPRRCVTSVAVIFSTTVQNTDGDGLLDVWKAPRLPNPNTPGYCDASINEGVCRFGDPTDPAWVALPGAKPGQKDVFVQLDYMCRILKPDGTCNYSLTAASDASGGNTTYTGTFSPTIPANSTVNITGFTKSGNNGLFTVQSNTSTQLVVNNPNGVSETPLSPGTAGDSFDPRLAFPTVGEDVVQEVTESFLGMGGGDTLTHHAPINLHVFPTHAIQ